jgi:hypothetical protein
MPRLTSGSSAGTRRPRGSRLVDRVTRRSLQQQAKLASAAATAAAPHETSMLTAQAHGLALRHAAAIGIVGLAATFVAAPGPMAPTSPVRLAQDFEALLRQRDQRIRQEQQAAGPSHKEGYETAMKGEAEDQLRSERPAHGAACRASSSRC